MKIAVMQPDLSPVPSHLQLASCVDGFVIVDHGDFNYRGFANRYTILIRMAFISITVAVPYASCRRYSGRGREIPARLFPTCWFLRTWP